MEREKGHGILFPKQLEVITAPAFFLSTIKIALNHKKSIITPIGFGWGQNLCSRNYECWSGDSAAGECACEYDIIPLIEKGGLGFRRFWRKRDMQ